MNPALSVIAFTTASGAGYGLLILFALHAIRAPAAMPRGVALTAVLLALVLIAFGLSASLFHLGRPERAWRAVSQWRSSWLSREGIAALATFVPHLALAALSWTGDNHTGLRVTAAACIVGAILTLYCTSRIYSSLETIHAWHNAYTAPTYFLLALFSGTLVLWALGALAGRPMPIPALVTTALLALAAIAFKFGYWRFLDRSAHAATPESATGLGRFGKVSQFEAPHTEENYLLREMGFKLARKHGRRLRTIVFGGLVIVLLAVVATWLLPAANVVFGPLALAVGAVTVFVERWLFFAEAKHVVTLYYGAPAA